MLKKQNIPRYSRFISFYFASSANEYCLLNKIVNV